jgi:molybdate transport system ATP-binding protein
MVSGEWPVEASSGMSLLEFNCRFRYPSGFQLDLAFEAKAGVSALLGPSGVGKTTALHLIAGLLRPSHGRIVLGQTVLFDSALRIDVAVEDRRIGLVFQDYQLFPHMTVDANLRYGNRRAGSPAFDFSHLVEVLELQPLLHRYPQSLSGGQRQRVALGRAIARCPAILLLDEPVSALDADLKLSVLDYLSRTLQEFKTPTLLVTHDVQSAERLQAELIRVPMGNLS